MMEPDNFLRHDSGIFRKAGLGAVPVAVVLLMLVAAFMPSVGAQGTDPDLDVLEGSLRVGPQPLVVGVPAVVDFSVANNGLQNAFKFNVSLFDHGIEVEVRLPIPLFSGG